VPKGQTWRLVNVFADYTSTATAGNRSLELRIKNAAGQVTHRFVAHVVQAASLNYYYNFGYGLTSSTAAANGNVDVGLPECYIESEGSLQVLDSAAVAAGADDMTLGIQFEKLY
jgi:hypothetical protein